MQIPTSIDVRYLTKAPNISFIELNCEIVQTAKTKLLEANLILKTQF